MSGLEVSEPRFRASSKGLGTSRLSGSRVQGSEDKSYSDYIYIYTHITLTVHVPK